MSSSENGMLKIPALSCSEIGIIHALGQEGIPTYTGSFFKDNPALYSRFTQKKVFFDCYDDISFIDRLCEFGETQEYRPVLYSDDDQAMLLISTYRERLSNYYRFLLPDHEIVKRILDKRLFIDLCQEYELPAPVSFEVNTMDELEKAIEQVPFPAIIKPSQKQAWWHSDFEATVGPYKKAYKCEDADELRSLFSKISKINKNVVVQEFVPGADDQLYSMNMFVNEQGEVKGHFLARKKRIYPITAGTGCYIVTIDNKKIIKSAFEISRKLDLKGLLNIQFKVDERTEEPRLMEIHIRNSYWGYLGPAAGMNLSAMYYYSLTGQSLLSNRDYNKGVKYIDLFKDLKAFFQYKKAGKMGFMEWLKTYRGDFVIGGMLLKDPLPTLANLWFIVQRRLQALFKNGDNKNHPG